MGGVLRDAMMSNLPQILSDIIIENRLASLVTQKDLEEITMSELEKQRRAFEREHERLWDHAPPSALCKRNADGSLDIPTNDYGNIVSQSRWEGWQAALATQTLAMEGARAAFERYQMEWGQCPIIRNKNGEYENAFVRDDWKLWQAALTSRGQPADANTIPYTQWQL